MSLHRHINHARETGTALTVVYFSSEADAGGCYRLSPARIQKGRGRVLGERRAQSGARGGAREPLRVLYWSEAGSGGGTGELHSVGK